MESIMEENNLDYNEDIILVAQEQFSQAFPDIDAEVIWAVLTSFECTERGIEDALNKIMELSGNDPIDFIDSLDTIIDNANSQRNDDEEDDDFDDEYNFSPPQQSSGGTLSSLASYIWTNITQRRGGSNYHQVSGNDEGCEMGMMETKKDQ